MSRRSSPGRGLAVALLTLILGACGPYTPSPAPTATGAAFTAATVSLGIYSGRPDPSWTLTDAQTAELDRLLEPLPTAFGDAPQGGLGYHGFAIVATDANGVERTLIVFRGTVASPGAGSRTYRLDIGRTVERFLLETGRPRLSANEIEAVETDLSSR